MDELPIWCRISYLNSVLVLESVSLALISNQFLMHSCWNDALEEWLPSLRSRWWMWRRNPPAGSHGRSVDCRFSKVPKLPIYDLTPIISLEDHDILPNTTSLGIFYCHTGLASLIAGYFFHNSKTPPPAPWPPMTGSHLRLSGGGFASLCQI